jgi:hypothetical protein
VKPASRWIAAAAAAAAAAAVAHYVCLQLTHADSRAAAAEQRKLLYKLTSAHVGRDAPETCVICCDPISPLKATHGSDEQLLLLGCAHCFHYK